MSQRPVSVLGLGPMGQALARAFLAAGHPTTVWNRTAGRSESLVAHGAAVAPSPAAAVAASPLVIACLVDDRAVHASLDPAVRALAGRTLVNLTSGTPQQARDNAAWAARHGAGYLDGAIMTPTPSIGQPSALILYSGPEQAYDAHRDTLAALGGTARYLGHDPGRAAAYDTALLGMFWMSVIGVVHGLATARAEGIHGGDIVPYAPAVFGMLPEMTARFAHQAEERRYPGERSTIASAAAGVEHLVATAQAHHIDTGTLAAARALLRRAVDAGYGADGLARLIEVAAEPAVSR